jgi:hypothetical protein
MARTLTLPVRIEFAEPKRVAKLLGDALKRARS